MELTVQNVYGLLIRSRLLPLEETKGLYERWLREGEDGAASVAQFSQWLVANQYVTEYQAGLLARGHADHFYLGPYKILERIGKGRMAGVYKAVHALGQIVAVKVLPPSKAKDPQLRARFQREACLALQLKHPNIVRAFQMGESNGLHYLVMEYLEGETLDEVLQRRTRLSPVEAVRLTCQALMGLQHIHDKGMIHRDLKPSNMMLVAAGKPGQTDPTTSATLKILDIGLGRPLYDEAVSARDLDQLTTEGSILGTPDYMAPEQARDARSSDIRADIYSLGCVLYHLLAGQPPFPDTNIINQMIRHATETPRPLPEFNAEVPDLLQQVVNWMMAKDPAQRYPTPERAGQTLRIFLHSEAATVRAPGAEQLRTPEAEPQMLPFLDWLEQENALADISLPADSRFPEKTPMPSAVKTENTPPPAPRTATLARKRGGKRQSARATHVPVSTPAETKTPVEGTYDVELVAPHAPSKASAVGDLFHLTRRDFIMMAAGAGSVLFAVFLGWLLAQILRPRAIDSTPSTVDRAGENRQEAVKSP